MTRLRSAFGSWGTWPSAAARRASAAALKPESAQQRFPATGAHWLDGWVVFGNTYV